jgi:hypothetical protein
VKESETGYVIETWTYGCAIAPNPEEIGGTPADWLENSQKHAIPNTRE